MPILGQFVGIGIWISKIYRKKTNRPKIEWPVAGSLSTVLCRGSSSFWKTTKVGQLPLPLDTNHERVNKVIVFFQYMLTLVYHMYLHDGRVTHIECSQFHPYLWTNRPSIFVRCRLENYLRWWYMYLLLLMCFNMSCQYLKLNLPGDQQQN